MDEGGMMKLWIDKIWHHRPGGLLMKDSCLVYDMFKTHMLESIKRKLKNVNTDVAIIPGGLTCQLQPLDVSINKPFKDKVRVLWSNWMGQKMISYLKKRAMAKLQAKMRTHLLTLLQMKRLIIVMFKI